MTSIVDTIKADLPSAESIASVLNEAVKLGSAAVAAGKDALPVAELIYNTFVAGGIGGTGLVAAGVVKALTSAFQIGSVVIQAGRDLAPVVTMLYNTFVLKQAITQDELDAFAAETDRLGAILMAPLPDPEPGEAD